MLTFLANILFYFILIPMGIAIVIAPVGALIWIVLDESKALSEDCDFKIKFSTFKDYYYLAPDKYRLGESYVTRNFQKIGFKGLGVIRYWIFHKQVKRNKIQAYKNKELKKYLELVQNDINKIRGREND